jgi:hypothetical protein
MSLTTSTSDNAITFANSVDATNDYASTSLQRSGCAGDKLILDRDPSGKERMRVALTGTRGVGEPDPYKGIVAAPTPPRPTTLKEEMSARRARKPPVDEVSEHVMEYLWNRYGDCISVDERMLKRRLDTYLTKFAAPVWQGAGANSDAE